MNDLSIRDADFDYVDRLLITNGMPGHTTARAVIKEMVRQAVDHLRAMSDEEAFRALLSMVANSPASKP